jgi:acyl transferase domain-containing protein
VWKSIVFFSDEELEKAGIASDLLGNPGYVKAYGFLEDVEYFDASFFRIYSKRSGNHESPDADIS